MGKTRTDDQNPDDGENKRVTTTGGLYNWGSSRIVRVSRATGGKDRHSKVLTSKGLRDRRVRLSVNTAIQFYDLQDRLGYDQPSKAVEWLLKAAATSIDELPPINPDQLGAQNQKSSACSSNSEGSGLSLSRSECRDNPIISQPTSFTQLLNGGMSNNVNSTNGDYFQKSLAHWSSSPMDYFTSHPIRPAQMYLAVNPPASSPLFSVTGEHQHFSFVPDHLLATGENNNSSNNNNLNFTISSSSGNNNSSGLAGFNRGTLQSNSSSFLPSCFSIGTALPHVENHHQFLPGFDPQANNGRYSGHRGGKGKN